MFFCLNNKINRSVQEGKNISMLDETKRFVVSNILNQWFHFKGGQRTKAFTTRFIFFTVPSYCPAPGRIFHFLKACLSLSLIVQSKLKLSGTTARKPANITTYQYRFLHLPPPLPLSQLSQTIPPVKWHQWIVINSNGKSYSTKSQIQWWREQYEVFHISFLSFVQFFP